MPRGPAGRGAEQEAGSGASASGHTPGGDLILLLGTLWTQFTIGKRGMLGEGYTSKAFPIEKFY